jgi:enterochelin esterase-like enzyme
MEPAATLIVWIPAAYTRAQDFVTAGFEQSVRARNLALDLLFLDLELDHLGDRSILERLRHEVIAPARARGSACIWLAGISLGGFLALSFAAAHPGDCDGLCLLAPYLGDRLLQNEIVASSGLAAWQPGPLAEADEERRIWRFIQMRDTHSPPLILGYGQDDRFARAHRLLAEALPSDAVHVVPGGHEWAVWSALWEQILDTWSSS